MSVKRDVWLLKGILFFQEVAKWGSITRAAQENGIKSANLSRVITELEDVLNLRLFDRRSTGMHLTAAGRMLLEKADELKGQLERLSAVRQKSVAVKILRLRLPSGLKIDISSFLEHYPYLNVLQRENGPFDVGVFWEKPKLKGFQISCHEVMHTDSLCQSLWIALRKKELDASLLADFITCQLHF